MFMVCQGYKAPDFIDPRLLDPKFALEQVEDGEGGNSTDKISSLKKLLTNKRNRSGYANEESMSLYHECEFMEFLKSTDPHSYLSGFNKFKMTDEAREAIKDLKVPKDIEVICEDIKCCGRRELSELLKLRLRYVNAIQDANRAANEKKKEEADALRGPKTQEELEAQVDRELQETLDALEKQKKRQAKKQREAEQKQDMRKKMSVIASTTIDNDDEMVLDKKTWAKLKQIEDADEIHKYIEYSNDSDSDD